MKILPGQFTPVSSGLRSGDPKFQYLLEPYLCSPFSVNSSLYSTPQLPDKT